MNLSGGSIPLEAQLTAGALTGRSDAWPKMFPVLLLEVRRPFSCCEGQVGLGPHPETISLARE